MFNSTHISLTDRLDRVFRIEAQEGESIADTLLHHHIPLDSVIVRKNGQIINEAEVEVSVNNDISVEMVRAYHLPDFLSDLGLWAEKEEKFYSNKPSIYNKRMLWFEENSEVSYLSERISEEEFPGFLEKIFCDCVNSKQLIQNGDTVGLALSGGRDSLSLLYLLANNKEQLPNFNLEGVTVCGLSKPKDLSIAKEASSALDIKHEFVQMDEIKKHFRLKTDMQNSLGVVLQKRGRAQTINCVHAFMRISVERYFAGQDIHKIAFGLHNEDLLASLIRSLVNGIPFGESFYRKTWGPFDLIYPLWGITKKELTIYLNCVAPHKHSAQGSPTAYDRGGHNRDIQYFIADSLQTLWPGFSYHAFEGYQKLMRNAAVNIEHCQCTNCQGVYLKTKSEDSNHNDDLCYLCSLLIELDQIE